MERPRIVIIGAGFGGMYAAHRLLPQVKAGEISLTLINRTNYFLFTPLLHEVATGGLSPTSVTEPLREIFAKTGVRICQGEVEAIDTGKRLISIPSEDIPYDYAVVATGADTNYYGIAGAEARGLPLKSLRDAVRIREAVIEAFERAARAMDPEIRARQLSFVVVGGGATGVEVAAELLEFAYGMERRYHRGASLGRKEDISITLLSAAPELLMQFHPALRRAASERLKRQGIEVRLNAVVTAVEVGRILFADGSEIPAATVIWTAGVKPELPRFLGEASSVSKGRIRTDRFLQAVGDERLFVLGDAASVETAAWEPPLPMLAQVAVAQADVIARNVMAAVRGGTKTAFQYRSKGSLVSLGQWFAVGEILNVRMSGRLAWWVWRTVYLFKFVSWKKRWRIAFEWTINLFSPRDITKLD